MPDCDEDARDSMPGDYRAVDLSGGETITMLTLFAGFPTKPRLEWSPAGDDRLLVSTIFKLHRFAEKLQSGPGVYVIDAEQDTFVLEETFDAFVDCAEWSPDGRFVAAYSCDGYGPALIFGAQDGVQPLVLLERDVHGSGDWTLDDRLVVYGGESPYPPHLSPYRDHHADHVSRR